MLSLRQHHVRRYRRPLKFSAFSADLMAIRANALVAACLQKHRAAMLIESP